MSRSLLNDPIKNVTASSSDNNTKIEVLTTRYDNTQISSKFGIHSDMVTAGTLSTSRIPNLDGSKITSGTVGSNYLELPDSLQIEISSFSSNSSSGTSIKIGSLYMYFGETNSDVSDTYSFYPGYRGTTVTCIASPSKLSKQSSSQDNMHTEVGEETFNGETRAYGKIKASKLEKPYLFMIVGTT